MLCVLSRSASERGWNAREQSCDLIFRDARRQRDVISRPRHELPPPFCDFLVA
jgi:hypothetical protein